ncbi:UNKNOWN [Stylonychia lemnae]|uniref:Uncharacterized protein n=1 Tax=Stylonychia lemnae TaxID=5949 RepID=A0A077ZU10_STYLE|nr:UNKNOWN [Stylonychia lemnae]|eukprot:CDW71941.1 UNKNOWN [Stylonychia lemnae]
MEITSLKQENHDAVIEGYQYLEPQLVRFRMIEFKFLYQLNRLDQLQKILTFPNGDQVSKASDTFNGIKAETDLI